MAGAGAGRTLMLLLVLVGLVGGAGAWNYNRNLGEEEALPRPWKGYSEADLQALADAYRTEIEQYSSRWDRARTRRVQARDGGHLDDRAREFERAQAHGQRVRELKGALAERQVSLEQIEEELALRRSLGTGLQLHLNRLLSLD